MEAFQGHGLSAFASRSGSLFKLLLENWVACILLMLATCLIPTVYKRFARKARQSKSTPGNSSKEEESFADSDSSRSFSFRNIFTRVRHRRNTTLEVIAPPKSKPPPPSLSPRSQATKSPKPAMRYQNRSRRPKAKKNLAIATPVELPVDFRTKQPYEAFLVVDIEGTCKLGGDFNYPNEIIEFPVCILQWKDRSDEGRASTLGVVDEFRTFVRPTWRPTLSDFCTELTGITQDQVDRSPSFPEVLVLLEAFLVKNSLIEEGTGRRLKKFCWCSDGPFDIRDFVVKQCFISQVQMPLWLQSDVLDVRTTVLQYLSSQSPTSTPPTPGSPMYGGITRRALNISAQLKVLGLPDFEGRQHSGIADTRNIAKVVVELARRGMCLLPNTTVHPGKRWPWMGKHGEVLDEVLT